MAKEAYIIAEAQNVNANSKNPCDDLYVFASEVYATHEAARDGLREYMRESVNAAYEGYDGEVDVDSILDEILDTENNDQWFWNAGDRSAVFRIVKSFIND